MPATDIKAEASYVNSDIALVTGGTYLGDGLNGWAGGTTYVFNVVERNPELDRPRGDATDGPYKEGRGQSVSIKLRLKGYFKGSLIPPSTIQNEFVRIQATTIFNFDGVIMVERFAPSGVIGQNVIWELTGETDGTFINA